MPNLGTVIGRCRALGYMSFSCDPIPRPAGAPAAAGLAPGEVAPELLGPLRRSEDERVDRLGADGPQADLDPAAEPAGDLLWRPAFGQPVNDEAAQAHVGFKDGLALAAEQV